MAQNSKIEWCEHTDNLWHGCTEVHEGCDNCYARVLSHRWGRELWGNEVPRMAIKSVWNDLNKQQLLAKKAGQMHKVFVGSMMDIFEKPMPVKNSKGEILTEDGNFYWNTGLIRDKFFNDIVPNSPNLLFLLLTKRPSNINKYIPESWKANPPENVMFGTSPVNQETANKLIPQLLAVNGKRFLSVEPMLDKIVLTDTDDFSDNGHGARWIGVSGNAAKSVGIHWVICGGESGHGKRPFNADWARSLRDQCIKSETPFFMKQMDKIQPIPEDLLIRQFPVI